MIYLRAIDVSGYQKDVPWDVLLANGVCDIAIIKGGQGQITRDHVNQARARGIKRIVLYFWQDPTTAVFYQILVIQNDIKEFQPVAVFLDSEQWWGDWDQYWQFLAGKLSLSQMTILSPQTISNHGLAVLTGVQKSYPNMPLGDYTARWFVQGWAQPMSQWLYQFALWVAGYFDYGNQTYKVTYEFICSSPPDTFHPALPDGVSEYLMLQYSSRMIYPGQSYPYDSNVTEKTKFLAWIKETEAKMMYDSTPQAVRTNVLTLFDEQAHADLKVLADGGTDAFILGMGGMDGPNGQELQNSSAFRIRVGQAKTALRPVIGRFTVAGDYHQRKQRTVDQVEGMSWENNEVLKQIITSLRVPGDWSFSTLRADIGWLPVHALILSMTKYLYASGQTIESGWQKRTLKNLIDPLTYFQDHGMMPVIPLIVFSNPGFFTLYAKDDLGGYLLEQHHRLYLGLAQWYFAQSPTASVLKTSEAWSFRLPENYNFVSTLYGYGSDSADPLNDGHVVYHEASSGRFLIETITDSNLKPVPANTGFGYTTKEKFYTEFLRFIPSIEPTPDPIQVQLDALNAKYTALEAKVKALEDKMEFHKL